MGCIWSLEEETLVPDLNSTKPNTSSKKPQFGEYYCESCDHSWKSLRGWSNKYQMCIKCMTPVYPHYLRKLRPSDSASSNHERELCQMCKQLGYACKNYGKKVKKRQSGNKRY